MSNSSGKSAGKGMWQKEFKGRLHGISRVFQIKLKSKYKKRFLRDAGVAS